MLYNEKTIKNIVGKNYFDFWNFNGRYRIVKGGRGSKKSKTTALNFVYRIMKYKSSNLLVIRKTYRTLKDSCFTEITWAINQLGVYEYWEIKQSPLEMIYKPTGQKIFFRGLDDPLKINSISVPIGNLCWIWIEEATEITNEKDFDILDESIRGFVPKNLFKQITLTFNPWSEKHWIKKRFFDNKFSSNELLKKTTTYLDNEFLDINDIIFFENMKIRNPKRYLISGLGEWGMTDDLIYTNWIEMDFLPEEKTKNPNIKSAFGLDFGYTNDPTALFCGLVDTYSKEIYVFDEIYERGLSNKKIYKRICEKGYSKERIRADSSEPKSIDELRELGLKNILNSRKGFGSVNSGIQEIQDFKIIIHPVCVNFLNEISNYAWSYDKFGNKINKPQDVFNHSLDAMRYAMEEFKFEKVFSFN
ncbi:MAG: PBSX family phage terminase large subunit [Clostridiales bacterium]|jgi:phage terminase large subunit|nr:PBSX family phage terminase large subunit [Clostridiales bacterium]